MFNRVFCSTPLGTPSLKTKVVNRLAGWWSNLRQPLGADVNGHAAWCRCDVCRDAFYLGQPCRDCCSERCKGCGGGG